MAGARPRHKASRAAAPPEPSARGPASRRKAGRSPAARSRLVDCFEQQARGVASMRELARLLDAAARELGFDHFALLHHSSLGRGATSLARIDTYPEGWEEEMLAHGLAAHDPVHLASVRTHIGFAWTRLGELIPLSNLHRDILARSGRFGLGEGFTVPVNVPGEPSGSCSFAVRRGRGLPSRRLRCAELVGAHAFAAARRLHGLPRKGSPAHLSRRQLQCLKLVAAGKTDWEIARILAISRETVRQYVKSARAAYDVVSRAQLVAHGLRDARISFEDAIDPKVS